MTFTEGSGGVFNGVAGMQFPEKKGISKKEKKGRYESI